MFKQLLDSATRFFMIGLFTFPFLAWYFIFTWSLTKLELEKAKVRKRKYVPWAWSNLTLDIK